MKAQERHELRENDLAGWLHYGLWAFIKQNGSYVLLVLALGFLGVQIYRLYSQRVETAKLVAWSDFNSLPHREDLLDYYFNTAATVRDADGAKRLEQAGAMVRERPQRLREIIDAHDIKPLKAACYMNMGVFYQKLTLLRDMLDDKRYLGDLKITRAEALEKSQQAFQGALSAMPDDIMITAQAHLGLAAVLEDQGEWDKARDEYKILTDKAGKYANTPFADLADGRLKTLDDRRNAPRLAAMIPFIPAPRQPEPSVLSPGLGLSGLGITPSTRPGGSGLPGLMSDGGLAPLPSMTTQPSTAPSWMSPFNIPLVPAPIGPTPTTNP